MGKILVVDDDRSVVFMLAEVLLDAGHEVVTAFETAGMLAVLDGVDAAFVDLHMAGESGLGAVARIRSYNALLPVILLTADVRAKTNFENSSAGVFEILTKPVDIDELSSVLERALGG